MDKTLDAPSKALWQALHADYVKAHAQYLRFKLSREAAAGQSGDLPGARNARLHLASAQEALAAFCRQHLG
jgi:hypothetical protein